MFIEKYYHFHEFFLEEALIPIALLANLVSEHRERQGRAGVPGLDLSTRFDDSGKDEFARISGMLNRTVVSIGEVIARIRTGVAESSRQSEELAEISGGLLASMEDVGGLMGKSNALLDESSSSLEAINAAIGEMASMLMELAEDN